MSIAEYRYQALATPTTLTAMTQQQGEVLTEAQQFERFDQLTRKRKPNRSDLKTNNNGTIPF